MCFADRLLTMICTKGCLFQRSNKSHSVACYLLCNWKSNGKLSSLCAQRVPSKHARIIASINKCAARYRKVLRDQIRVAALTGGLIAKGECEKRRTTGGRPHLLSSHLRDCSWLYARALHRALHSAGEGKKEKEKVDAYVGSSPVLHGRLHLLLSPCAAARHGDTRPNLYTGRYNFLAGGSRVPRKDATLSRSHPRSAAAIRMPLRESYLSCALSEWHVYALEQKYLKWKKIIIETLLLLQGSNYT